MMIPRISSICTPSAIAGIEWPLRKDSSPPLYYKPLEELCKIRSPAKTPDGRPFKELPGLVSELPHNEQGYFGRIALALLLLGHGYPDECHDLVLPLSWPEDMHIAYGPSVYQQASESVRAYSSYAHCLVHRREAFHVGEFGMVGFENADFWSNAVTRERKGVDALPHKEWKRGITQLARDNEDFSRNAKVQEWCQRHGFVMPLEEDSSSHFDSETMHDLCANVLRDPGVDPVFRDFAQQAAALEVKILLRNALKLAGCKLEEDSTLNCGEGAS
mmetsp:Transcript_6941/g.12682  ORF Transcript_6941/g.12682 Transcript_6941/m.12682 type:complete len:274 (-) Transcript_6941:567-1388(-)